MKLFTAWVEIEARKDKYQAGVRELRRTTERDTRKMSSIWEKHGRSVQKVGLTIAAVGVGITATVGLLAKSFVSAAVDMEKMMKGLTAVAGSASEAATQLKELREVAKLPGLGLAEAVKASINLQAVRFSAEKAATFLKVMGNALATVGKGREDLAGVVRGMSQMQSRGKVLAEEINQISERIPQFRAAMLDAFGTATSEEIQKMGITVEEFLDRTVAELAKLPAVAGGTANAIENLRDAWFQLRVELGQKLLPAFTKIVDMLASVVDWFNNLSATQQRMVAWGTAIGLALGTIATVLGGIMAILPSVIAGFAALSAISLGPVGLGIVAVGAAVTGLAVAYDQYARSKSNAFQELETIKNNATGITAAIDNITKAIDGVRKAGEEGKKRVSLLPFDVKGLGTDVLPIDEQIKKLTRRFQDLSLQLIVNQEGLGKTFTERQAQMARAYGWEVGKTTEATTEVAESTGVWASAMQVLLSPLTLVSQRLSEMRSGVGSITALTNELKAAGFLPEVEGIDTLLKARQELAKPELLKSRGEGAISGFIHDEIESAKPELKRLREFQEGLKALFVNPFRRSSEFKAEQRREREKEIDEELKTANEIIGNWDARRDALADKDEARTERRVNGLRDAITRENIETQRWFDNQDTAADKSENRWQEYGNAVIDVFDGVSRTNRIFNDTWLENMGEWARANKGILKTISEMWAGTAENMLASVTNVFATIVSLIDTIVDANREMARLDREERGAAISRISELEGVSFREAAKIHAERTGPLTSEQKAALREAGARPRSVRSAVRRTGARGFSSGIEPPKVIELAAGGIVTQPTLAMIGERGPEAVVPLQGASGTGIGGVSIGTLNITPVFPGADIRSMDQNMFNAEVKYKMLGAIRDLVGSGDLNEVVVR